MKYTYLVVFSLIVLICSAQKNSKNIQNSSLTEKKSFLLIETEFGNMTVILYNQTPLHRDNFLKLAKEGYFDSLLFHRIIPNFMIQGGDPNSKNAAENTALGMGGPGYTVPAEFNDSLIHKKGALAAARTGGPSNPEMRSSGSQFYIVQGSVYSSEQLANFSTARKTPYNEKQKQIYSTIGGTPHLDGQYTIFGEVTKGLEVIDKIAVEARNRNDRPLKNIIMKVKVLN